MADFSILHDLLLPVLGVTVTIMLGIISWLGVRLHSRVDDIPVELAQINETLHKIEVDLRRELASHDSRLSVVEAKVSFFHPN